MRSKILLLLIGLLFVSSSLPVFAQRTKERVAINRQYIDELSQRMDVIEAQLTALPEALESMGQQLDQMIAQNARDGETHRQDLLVLRQQVELLSLQLMELKNKQSVSSPPQTENQTQVNPADQGTAPLVDTNAPSPISDLIQVDTPENSDLSQPLLVQAEREIKPPVAPTSEPKEAPVLEVIPEQPDPAEEAARLLRQARADLLRGRYNLAGEGFDSVLALDPAPALAAEALFGKAQAYQSKGDFEQALDLFLQVPEKFPDSRAAPAALLRAGQTLNGLGRREDARAALDQLKNKYPQSEEARLAALGSSLRQN